MGGGYIKTQKKPYLTRGDWSGKVDGDLNGPFTGLDSGHKKKRRNPRKGHAAVFAYSASLLGIISLIV